MLESYLLTTDGKEYIDANSVREALGIVDEHVDILGVIKKLKEERDGLKADLELTNRIYKEHHDFVDKVCEAVDIQRPYIESGYDNAVGLIAGFKRERDELKEKCDNMKKRANAMYGVSCGKEPAFLCDVISYSWGFGPIDAHSLMDEPFYRVCNDSIRVELNLTPTANYKGTFDLEDLKKYIQAYGREKKLSDFEVFCKLVDDCIDELCDKYNVVQPDRSQTTRGRLDYIFGVLAENRERYNSEWKWVEQLKKEKRAVVDSLAELRAKIREIYKEVFGYDWEENQSYVLSLNDITELARGEKLLIEFRDAVAKAIGMDYPTTNQVILQNVKYIYKDREDAYGMVSKLNDQVTALEKAKEDLQQMLIDSRYGGLNDSQRDLLGEYLREAKDVLGIDTCEKDTVASAIKALKSAYEKLQKDYDELGEAYSSVLKWNNSYAEVRRLLGVSADADADEMVDTLDQLIADRERCKRRYENWYSRYESEHERANGEHKRAEKLCKDVTALSNHIELLKLSNASQANSVVASQAFKNECRKLKEEKAKVIAALGQDIWDDCVK